MDTGIANELPDEVFGAGYLNTLSRLQTEQLLAIATEVLKNVSAPEGAHATKLHKRLFDETPGPETDERATVRHIARSFARDAYRRPPSEAEIVLLRVYHLGRENNLASDRSLRLMFNAILASPQFLFITPAAETEPESFLWMTINCRSSTARQSIESSNAEV